MKPSSLTDLQRVRFGGYTSVVILDQTDLAASTVNGAQLAVALKALSVGDVIERQCFLEVVIPAVGLATCTASLGVTGAPTQFIAAKDMIAGVQYFSAASAVADYDVVAGGPANLVVNFTPGGGEPLSNCTALQIHVWYKLNGINQRALTQY